MQRPLGWTPRSHRQDFILSGTALLSDGREIGVRLLNLSPEGCRLESDETLTIGHEVFITAGPLERMPGKVRWSLSGIAGLRFSQDDLS